jgi:outer membrane lipoprotein carrier protein
MKAKINTIFSIVVLIVVLLLSPRGLTAKSPELAQILDAMQKRYNSTQTYKTAFEQTLKSAAFKKVIRNASGTIYYTRPGKIKWVYEKPDKHLYLIDGETFWDYDETEKQVIKIPLKDALAGSVPQGFLFGAGNFQKDFDVKLMGHSTQEPHKGYALSLTPRDKDLRAAVSDLELLVSDEDYGVLETRFDDAQGNINYYIFTDSVLNPKLDPGMFIFKIPEGVKVILPMMPGEMPPPR